MYFMYLWGMALPSLGTAELTKRRGNVSGKGRIDARLSRVAWLGSWTSRADECTAAAQDGWMGKSEGREWYEGAGDGCYREGSS